MLITVVVLYAAYRVYAAVVAPMTVPVVELSAPGASAPAESHLPSDAENVARTYLPSATWAPEAKFTFKIGQESHAYFDKQFRIGDGRQNRIRLSPFAVVWFDPKNNEQVPYTLTADTAVIEFEDTVELGSSSGGRIVGGQLTGNVHIAGPDGLRLDGQDFTLSEESGRLYSDRPIQFAFGPAEGEAEQVAGRADQIDITLVAGGDSLLGDDLPRIGGIKQITLRRNVNIDMVVEDDGPPTPVAIHCDGTFAYDVQDLVATLSENVNIARPTHDPGQQEQFDRLQCDQLVLQFEERREDDSDQDPSRPPTIQKVSGVSSSHRKELSGLNLELDLRAVRALGSQVYATSDKNDVTAKLQDLRYDLKTRTLRMLGDERVDVTYRNDLLVCADIELTHNEDGGVQTATCHGSGSAYRFDPETRNPDVESYWNTHLILRPDELNGQTLLEMSGEARVLQRSQESGVMGDVLSVWLESTALDGIDEPSQATERFPIRRVLAEQTGDDPVAMVSPSLHLETKRLEAIFQESADGQTGQRGGRESNDLLGSRSNADANEPPVIVSAGEVQALMTFDPNSEKTDFAEVRASTAVRISRSGPKEQNSDEPGRDGPFSIECENMILVNAADGHILRLLGQPAHINLPRNDRIEGNDILFDRGANRAEVIGPGTLVVHVDRDLDGERLDDLLPLTTKWRERMTFDGQNAAFLKETVTTLSDSVLKCEELEVSLNRAIDFSEDRPNTKNIEVQTVHGRHNVLAEFHEWSERTKVKGIRMMDVADFSFDQETGKFHARGPGTIRDWQKGNGRSPIAVGPSAVSRANETVEDAELPWNYTQLKFAGDMNGNQNDRYVELENRVEVIHAPVEHAMVEFTRGEISDLSESAKNAVWLGSDQMRFTLVPSSEPGADDTMEIIAFGNAEIEGQTFGATGHSISYDQSKELFTLRGGATDAHIWQQDSPGATARRQSAKMIRYIPSKQLILDGTKSINLSQ